MRERFVVVVAALALAGCSSGGGGGTDPQPDVAGDVPVKADVGDTGADDAASAVEADAAGDAVVDVALPDVDDTVADLAGDADAEAVEVWTDTGPVSHCLAEAVQGLPAVTIEFTSADNCTWKQSEVAAGIDLPYRLTVSQSYDIVPEPQDKGSCGALNDAGLNVFATIEGNDQKWCACDQGTCSAPGAGKLKVGSWDYKVHWDGKNWNGPGGPGENKPEGDAFPIGWYKLTISIKAQAKLPGMSQWIEVETTAAFNIQIVADPLPDLPEPPPDVQEVDYYIPPPEVVEEDDVAGDTPPPDPIQTDAPDAMGFMDCTSFCTKEIELCSTHVQYKSESECESACAAWDRGTPADMVGNTLGCRVYYIEDLIAWPQNVSYDCPATSASGGSACR